MSVTHRWRFLKSYLSNPHGVGALTPSSAGLAAALCEPFRKCRQPARVLEVGAGTGAVTRHLGKLLGDQDELDICEVETEFADILERDVLTRSDFAPAMSTGRVRLLRVAVQELSGQDRYDFIISGLPLSSFELAEVPAVYHVVEHFSWHTGQITWIAKLRKGAQHGIAFYEDDSLNAARNRGGEPA